MSIEFKFRAWDTKRLEMYKENRVGDCFRWLNEGQTLIVMQFTGVKDMDGRDIYDGDIISDPEKMYVYRISYNAPLAGYIMTRLWSNSLRDIQRLEAANMEINHMVIIGNIHEDTAK